jgi:hypothetical protein
MFATRRCSKLVTEAEDSPGTERKEYVFLLKAVTK